jgi:putative DNA primase/helicase
VARSILREAYDAPDHQRDSLTKHARATARRGQLEAMLSLARTDLAVESKDLDADPLLLNCTNGTVDLQTGALRPHRSADMLTRCTTCAYWPDAHLVDSPGAGEWRKFIKAITNGNDELAAYLQRAAGYSVTGDPCEEALFFAYGPERTGKSTFLATVGYHLADYADQVDFTAFLRKRDDNELRPELDKLQGKRFAASSETNAGRTMAEGLVKAITGNEPISTAAKYKDPVTWTPAFTLWLAANDRPVVRHNDGALWRRLKVVPFLHQVAPEAVDTGLKARLRQTAGEAVLAWLVAGCLTWRQEGLGTCAAVEEAIAGYREEMDPLGGWLADRCDVRLGRDDWFTPTEDLYQSFRRWCEESGEPLKLTQRQFGDHLSARHLTHARKRYNGEPRRGYVAIRLTEQPQFGFDDEDLPSEEASIRHAVPDAHHLPAHPENTLTEPVREASAGGGVPGVQGGCTNSAGAKSHVRLSDKSGTCRHSGTPGAEVDPFASEDPLPPLTPDEGARW